MKHFVVAVLVVSMLAGCTKTGGGPTAINSLSCGAPADPPAPTAKRGTLRISIQQDVKNLNPLLSSNTTDGMLQFLAFLPLVHANPKGDPVATSGLAAEVPTLENGGISKDGLTITYHLRKNIKWTDGVPVTSKDVKWSWQAIMSNSNNIISRHGYDFIKSVDTPDDYTVVVHLIKKFSPIINTFFADSDQPYPVVPAHILSKYPNINQIAFNSAPTVSDGPFKFQEWAHGDHITYVANDAFFKGKPGLAKIVVKIVPDENTMRAMLQTHSLDWMFEASLSNYPQVKNIPGVCLAWVDVNGYEDVQLNVEKGQTLNDVHVRRAVAYAIDKKRIVDTLTFGQTRIAVEDQPFWMWSFYPNVQTYPPSIAAARKELTDDGYKPRASDGIMMKNGQPLTLTMVSNNSNVTRRKNSIELQQMLHQAGIIADIKYYPGDVLFAPVGEGGILQGGKFDLSLAGWYAGIDPDDASQFACANMAPKGYNYSRYCNKDMEAAQKIALNNYDRPTRKKAYELIQTYLARDLPEIFLYDQRAMHPISVNFKGFAPNPVTESWNAWQWSI
ncbi:MAG TPA: peptide ABC transporter substrate-binding protein [Candidatus Rubrimentiphilum sp.]|nr:peptide ABC transporter substrate-binding protein [Candidatus Rubrimentiphilum sp.]